MRRSLVPVVLVALWFFACGTDQPAKTSAVPSDVDAFLARVTQAVTREGSVYHVSAAMSVSTPGNPTTPMYVSELWMDTANHRARFELESREGMEGDGHIKSTDLAVGNDIYSSDGDRVAKSDARNRQSCPNVPDPSLGWLICGLGQPEEATASVTSGVAYHGRRADALVFTREVAPDRGAANPTAGPDPQKPITYTFRFLVDADSYLPLGSEADAVQGGANFGHGTTDVSGEFVPASSLAEGFFDPVALGYVSPEDQERALLDSFLADGPYYWLGRHFDAGSALPPLDFSGATDTKGAGERGSVGMISYLGGGNVVYVENWSSAAWTAYWDRIRGGTPWGSNCAKRVTEDLPLGRATIWLGYRRDALKGPGQPSEAVPVPVGSLTPCASSTLATPTPRANDGGSPFTVFPTPAPRACTGEPFDVAIAWIEVSGRVVTINALLGLGSIAMQKSGPFDTLAGMEALLRGLRAMQPGE